MWKFLNNLFMERPKGMGALLNPTDPRDIPVKAFQSQKRKLPEKHITDISNLPVLDQKANGSCVGHAVSLAVAYYDAKETGDLTNPSPRFIYGLAKRIDGLPTYEGTYPRVAGQITKLYGCATENTLVNDSMLPHKEYITFDLSEAILKDAKPRKIGGYAFASSNIDELKNAIINNGVVCVSLTVGRWRNSPVKPGVNGRHYILVYGYNGNRFYFRNSWGNNWGDDGEGYFLWEDHKDTIADIMVITDIPNEIIKEYKKEWEYKYFKPTEKTGSMGTCADLNPKLLEFMDRARHFAGIPFKLTSGYRTVEQNKKVGGAKKSAHLKGMACDISAPTPEIKNKILYGIKKAGQDKVFTEIANRHIHIDIDSSIHKLGTTIIVDDE